MFDDLLNIISTSSMSFATNLSSWNHKIFACLILIEFLLIVIFYLLQPDKIEEMPIKLGKLLLCGAIGGVLFMYLPHIWNVGWQSIQYVATKAGASKIAMSPADMLNDALRIVGHLFASAAGDGGWNPLKVLGNVLISVVISFAVFFLFTIVIIEVVANYIMWTFFGAIGGIFVVMYVFKTTRPSFNHYIKYMCGLLLKSLGLFVMISMLSVTINNYSNYDKDLGLPPTTPHCTTVQNINKQIVSCSTTQCRVDLQPSLQDAEKQCNTETEALNAYKLKASHGFMERGLILILVLVIFVTLVKTIPSAMASLVGFGNYDIKGIGQAMGAIAMGAGAAKLLGQSNPVQAAGAGIKAGAGAIAGGVGGAVSGVVSAGANNQVEGWKGTTGRVVGKGFQGAGSASKYAGSKIGKAAQWAGSAADPEKAKAHRRKIVEETMKQFNSRH